MSNYNHESIEKTSYKWTYFCALKSLFELISPVFCGFLNPPYFQPTIVQHPQSK